MTPKERAIYLFRQMAKTIDDSYRWDMPKKATTQKAKQCALISVDQILKGDHLLRLPLKYWEQVKEEIEAI